MHLFRRLTLLQDNAPPHRDRHTLQWLADNNIPVYNDYPPSSPELNAIEYVWGWMKNYIADRDPRTSRRLGELIQDAWDTIPQETIQSYIDHVYRLVQAVRRARGGHADM
jgi:transposase